MVSENKSNIFSAVAGVVVGAGAAIVGATILADKKNRQKVNAVIAKGQDLARNYVRDVNEQAGDTKEMIEDTADLGVAKVKKLVEVVKTAKKGVQNI